MFVCDVKVKCFDLEIVFYNFEVYEQVYIFVLYYKCYNGFLLFILVLLCVIISVFFSDLYLVYFL